MTIDAQPIYADCLTEEPETLEIWEQIAAPSKASSFHYTPLDASRKEIRLLTLVPSSKGQRTDKAVECHLGHYSLDEVLPEYEGYHRPTSEPLTSHRYVWGDYAALSYVWGERTEESRICINGIEVKIRSNLAAALEVIRDSPEVVAGLKLWVDAICINQLDNEEKRRQIRHMGSIYAYSRLVFLWLGQGTKDSDLAFRGANSKNETDTTLLYRGGLKAICRICLNAYWYRLWTFQEIVLGADSSIVLCGTNRCTSSTFASAISSLLAVRGYMGIPIET